MKTYNVTYWEQKKVWVRQTITIETDKELTPENLPEIIENEKANSAYESDDRDDYNYSNDFEIEEV